MTMIEANPAFIIAAYAVTWVGLIGYGWYLARKGARARTAFEGMARETSGETRT